MKLLPFLKASLFALAAMHAVSAQPAPAETPAPAAGAEPAADPTPVFTEDQLLETFGWFVGRRIGIAELAFNPGQIEAIIRGIKQAASGGESPFDLDAIGPQLDVFMQAKQEQYMTQIRAQSQAESDAFMAEAAKKPGVQVLPSGVVYEVVQPGSGDFPKPSDTVKVHYTGTLVDGSVFDSSMQRGEPAEFRVDEVIEGWQEGIQKINKGGKLKLYVPAALAYGDNPPPESPIPPAAALSFDIELLDIIPAAAPAETPPAAPAN